MPYYHYKAVDEHGRTIKGQLKAAGSAEVEQCISQMGLTLITSTGHNAPRRRSYGSRVPRRTVIHFTAQLGQLIQAGVPLLTALADLRDTEDHTYFRNLLAMIITHIESGDSFAQAIEKYSHVFSGEYVHLIRAGEQSGKLATLLEQLEANLKWQDNLLAKAKTVATYPLIVLALTAAAGVFITVYLIPQLIPFLQSTQSAIPFYTQWLIALSNFMAAYGIYLSLAIILLLVTLKLYMGHNRQLRHIFDTLKIRCWLLGNILLKIKLARFTRYFGLMYAAGITVPDALKLCRPTLQNKALETHLKQALGLIEAGSRISESFSQVGLFPPLVTRMLKTGEVSGNIDRALFSISNFYARDVDESIAQLQPIVTSIVTIILAVFLFWVAAATLLPLYGIFV